MKTHKLKIYRKRKRITRSQLCQLLGLRSVITIYNWERWASRPSPSNALAIENLTDGEITTKYLLYG